MKRLFLLDAYALIYRAYYALIRAPRFNAAGINTSAIFGFCNTLDDLLRKENPTHIAVCFDPPGGKTFRHEAYEGYKAQRDKQPEDITNAIPYIKAILEAYRIPVIEVAGYEADDVIGTLSRMAEREGFETYMMTPDKDYGQLVTDRVFMYRPALKGEGFEVRGPHQVCERYGIDRPSQVIDLLALEGDVSDNVPGCPGVGEKTARKLIQEYGTVEEIISHAAEIKGALGGKIRDNVEQIKFSKFLVTIKTDVPLPEGITPDGMVRQPEDIDMLREIYTQLEFRSFISRLNARTGPKPAAVEAPLQPSLFDAIDEPEEETAVTTDYITVKDAAELGRLVERAAGLEQIGLSVLGNGEEVMRSEVECLAIALGDDEAYYLSLAGDDRGELLTILEPLFNGRTVIVNHNVKRDMLLMRRMGVEWRAPWFDTAVAHYLLDAEAQHDLSYLAKRYLKINTGAQTVVKSPASTVIEASLSLRLRGVLTEEIERAEMLPLLNEIELPMVKVLADMEWNGVRVDAEELNRLSTLYTGRLVEMEQQVYELAGHRFNIGSPAQVGEVLFGELNLDPKAKKTSKGFFSTTEKILEKHRNDHPIVELILKIRKLRKLVATYLDTLPTLINPETGKIHSTFNQTVTATGRISSANPNLQNIPIRSDDGREIRRAFIADRGCMIMSADYSQIELRLIADMSADPDMVDAFLHNDDIHRATAAKIYGVAPEDVTDNQRRNAKTANFGIIYGISAFGLSEGLGIPRSEAKALIDGYFATYPGIKSYLTKAVEDARQRGYVSTVFNRRRMLADINSRNAVVRGYAERNAVNAPIQGTAADIIKIAMVRIARRMSERGMRSTMIMQVHDELVFNVVADEVDAMRELVVKEMEGAYAARVPLIVSLGMGSNWLEAH